MPPRSRQANDRFNHEVRTALTVAKFQVQLLARRRWPLDSAEREQLVSRLKLVDEALDRVMRQVIAFVEEKPADGERLTPTPWVPSGMEGGSGRIVTEKSVVCGRCAAAISSGKPADRFRDALRDRGWIRTNAYGWLCPDCGENRARATP